MAAVTLELTDLTPFVPDLDPAKGAQMIADALGTATWVAPCLAQEDLTEGKAAAAKAIIRRAILRWVDAGSGGKVTQQQQAGPFGQMVTVDQTRSGRLFWPSEINDLQKICQGDDAGEAFTVDMAPTGNAVHLDWCTLMLGGNYCSCGADIAGVPIYELG